MTFRLPPPLSSVRWTSTLALILSITGPLALYVLTLPRTVVLEDDGLFLMAAEHLGIAHPPGYPLFTGISHLFMQLPFGTGAFRGHLSSAVLGALACGSLYGCARVLGISCGSALAGAWAFGASEHFWSQAIIAEVYTLNALLFFVTYLLILKALQQPDTRRWWWGAAVAYGLSLANHYPLMALAFPGLVVLALPAWRVALRRLPELLACSLLSAALPYAWMVWRSQQNPLISFYGPIEGWRAFWYYFSRQGYSGVDISPSAGWWDRWEFLQWFASETFWQLTPLGFLLAFWGGALALGQRRWGVIASGAVVFLSNSLVLLVLLGFDFDFLNIAVFRPYSLICYGLLGLWLGWGLDEFARIYGKQPRFQEAGTWVLGCAMAALLTVQNLPHNSRASDTFAEQHAALLFELLPPDAALFVYGDSETGPLGYYRQVEQRRPDVELISLQGLVYANRLFPARSSRRLKQETLRKFVESSNRPLFYTVDSDQFPHGQGVRHYGFFKEVLRGGGPDALQLVFRPEAEAFFRRLLQEVPSDRWERFRRNKLLHQYGDFLGYALLGGGPELQQKIQALVPLAESNYFSLTGMIEVLMQHRAQQALPRIEAWLKQAEPLRDETLDKERTARFHYLKGFVAFLGGRREEALREFQESARIYPHPENASIPALEQLGQRPTP
jgi:hypothetical protein